MVGVGAAATVWCAHKGEPRAIWLTLGYFTAMEALQVAGYAVVDECASPANRTVTLLSYLHIAFQPFFINAFAMALMGGLVTPRMRAWVFAACGVASLLMIARLVPFAWAGACQPGSILCGADFCTLSGDWHIGWEVPLNDMWGKVPLLGQLQFLEYMAAAFLLPLLYGAWRFAVFHAICGPFLASLLTTDPNEMPAVWCLFSIGLLLVGMLPALRRPLMPRAALA